MKLMILLINHEINLLNYHDVQKITLAVLLIQIFC